MTVKQEIKALNQQLLEFYDPAWGLDLPEGESRINEASRNIIDAMQEEAGAAWLGNVNLYDYNRNGAIIWQWNGGMV